MCREQTHNQLVKNLKMQLALEEIVSTRRVYIMLASALPWLQEAVSATQTMTTRSHESNENKHSLEVTRENSKTQALMAKNNEPISTQKSLRRKSCASRNEIQRREILPENVTEQQ